MTNIKITYMGHSTILIESGRNTILTDPVLGQKILFLKRLHKISPDPGNLPEISVVLVSHTHLDHLDFESFNYFNTSVPVIVPEGSGRLISNNLPNPMIELSHWAEHRIGSDIKIRAVPASHSNGFVVPYRFKHASGYVISISDKNIFFAGDTAYGTHFLDIGNSSKIDVALLPVGGYSPKALLKRFHMDPADALQAFEDLRADIMVPVHWGTFKVSMEKPEEPIEWLQKLAAEKNITDKIRILRPGESYGL